MRTPFAIALLIGAVLLNPVAHATSIAGNVSCSGELSALSATFGHLSCAGNLSLSDAVVADPIKLVLEASGSLTLLRSTLEAPKSCSSHRISTSAPIRYCGRATSSTSAPRCRNPLHQPSQHHRP